MSPSGSGQRYRVERRLRDPSRRRQPAPARVVRAWRRLSAERRLAALAATCLFLTLFLPWYQETVIEGCRRSLCSTGASLTGWAAFSFVEAAVLLVAAGVLVLLFTRAEGRAFHLPGGDGGVITVAGIWTCVLIVWRVFDKEGTSPRGQLATTAGIEWGIFVALGVAALLAYSGSRIRRARDPEPPLPGERRGPEPRTQRAEPLQPRAPRAEPRTEPLSEPSRPGTPVVRRRPRSLELDVDPDATAEYRLPPRTRVPPVAAAPEPLAEEPTRVTARDEPVAEGPTQVTARDEPATDGDPTEERPPRSSTHPFDSGEIAKLGIAEPPASRLRRIPSRFAPSEPDAPDS
jgi:hypothetical protein